MACALLCSISSAFVRPRFLRESTTTLAVRLYDRQAHLATWPSQTRQFSSADDVVTSSKSSSDDEIPLYKCQGLLAVEKPLDWTSSDVVSYIRGILERDAKNRGANVTSFRARRNKSQKIKVGHGGTLDPLATGVLVIGVGKGTKELQE